VDSAFATRGGVTELGRVADVFAALGARIAAVGHGSALQAVADVAKESLAGAAAVSITTVRHGHYATVAATDDRAVCADAIQYELGSGPCIDAILKETIYQPQDLRTDHRWPEFGARVSTEVGFLSMLSYRMVLGADDQLAGLNVYAEHVDAFSNRDIMLGLLLTVHGATATVAATEREQVEHLERALASNRRIGTAMGILMAVHKVTDEQAFHLLRIASQNTNRKLAELAQDVIDTGTLDVVPAPRLPHPTDGTPTHG
jgi:hypothetical protein